MCRRRKLSFENFYWELKRNTDRHKWKYSPKVTVFNRYLNKVLFYFTSWGKYLSFENKEETTNNHKNKPTNIPSGK